MSQIFTLQNSYLLTKLAVGKVFHFSFIFYIQPINTLTSNESFQKVFFYCFEVLT